MISATRPTNICLLILHINTCEHYNNFMTKYINNILVIIVFLKNKYVITFTLGLLLPVWS